jgi:hypothetical protein
MIQVLKINNLINIRVHAGYPYTVFYKNSSILHSDSYAEPPIDNVKRRLQGICVLEDDKSQVYREASLFYIQINGYVSNEQAQAYIPSIINAWNLYYTPIQANLSIINSKIIGKQYRFNNFNIITRIFYQVVGNYSTSFDAFNYQGKISSLLQVPYGSPNLVALSFIILNQRNLVRKLNLDLLLDQLPQIKIENEITHKDKKKIEEFLETNWINSNLNYFFIKMIILSTEK